MVKIIYKNNKPFIDINGEAIAPAAFRSFRPTPSVISMFSNIGVRLFQLIISDCDCSLGVKYSLFGGVWKGENCYDFSAFDRQLEMFMKFAPNGYFCLMLQLDPPKWWTQLHPDIPSSYDSLGQAIVSEKWRNDIKNYLKTFITYAEEKYGDKIYCYSFSCGYGTEWFSNDMSLPDKAKAAAYRKYTGDSNAAVPPLTDYPDGVGAFREPDSEELRYLKYCSTLTPQLIVELAAEAQSILNHQKLIGIFFGYIILSTKLAALWGTAGYEKVWSCDDIDMLFSPAAYGENRELDGVALYQVAVDSIMLHNKIYLHEIDHRTNLACFPLENGSFLDDCYNTEAESIAVLRRELCQTLVKNSSLWWFDFFGGYYSTPSYMSEMQKQLKIYNKLSELPCEQVAEIAVFVDPISFLYIRDNNDITHDCVRRCLTSLSRCGAPYQLFNLSDLALIDTKRYKLFVFLNAFEIDDSIRNIIDTRLNKKYKFFVYAPNYAKNNHLDVKSIEDITGMRIKPVASCKDEFVSYGDITYSFSKPANPMFEITDSNAEILGTYKSGKCAYAQKDNTFYSAVGNIPFEVFRDAAELAGVHIYNKFGDGLIVCSAFIASYTVRTENCELMLVSDCTLHEAFDKKIYTTSNKVLKYKAKKGQTRLFVFDK